MTVAQLRKLIERMAEMRREADGQSADELLKVAAFLQRYDAIKVATFVDIVRS